MSSLPARSHLSPVLTLRGLSVRALAVLITATSAVAQSPDMSGIPGMPWTGETPNAPSGGVLTRLVALPPLPPGAEMTFTPIPDSAPAVDLEQVRQEAAQRAEELLSDLRTIGPIQGLPAAGSAEFTKLRADALAIMKRRFQESRGALESDAVAPFEANVTWTPDFSATPRTVRAADRERARSASYSVAYAITHLDRPRFVLAYAAALFALDPDSALGAENAASAILASGERLYPNGDDAGKLKPFRDDAAVVYRYALACSVADGKWSPRSLGVLINLGNLYVDLKDAERARPVLLGAVLFAPNSWDAAVALAGCYEMQGRSKLARAVLENARLSPSSVYSTMTKGSKNLADTLEASDLSPESPDTEFEAVLKKFDEQEILTAADFVAQLDQSQRNRMRSFVNNLPVQGSYRAPEIDGLTQFSTAKAINQPQGIQALGDFAEKLGAYSLVLLGRMMQQQEDFLAQMGLHVQLNVDVQDVLAHPEKYRNHEVKGTVTGVEQLKSRLAQMQAQLSQAGTELAMGKVDTLLQIGAQTDPILAVHQLKAHEFANPMDVLIQQYNASMLGRKMNAYNAYFFSVNNRTRESLAEILRLYTGKMMSIREQENADMKIFEQQRAAAARSGANIHSAEWKIREHKIHMKYVPQYNDTTDFAWKEATQTASLAYERKIAPRAERFYYDVFRHIALISDPAVRAKEERDFAQMLHHGVYQGLVNVLSAFGSYEHVEDWDCRCDLDGLNEQAEREQQELDRLAEARQARESAEKLRFQSGALPESSPLFEKIDAYGTDLDIPFIPYLSGRISCARTTVTFEAELPTSASPKVNYTFTENAFTGATTHGGGIEVSADVGEEGGPKTSVTLNVKGAIAMDGKGKVTDYSVTGATDVKIEMGPASVHAGAEIEYTKAGGFNSDVNGGAQVSLDFGEGASGELSLEASARRGSTFSAKAEYNYNPFSEKYDAMINEIDEEVFGAYPVDTSIKKEIWSGSYTL